jgi:AhpD family alkylhydroperoxidase
MKALVTLGFILASGVATAAPAKQGALDGGKYRVVGMSNGKAERDTLVFERGMLHSLGCDMYGFAPGAYQAKKNGDAVDFEATIKSKAEGQIVWKGSVKGGKISGKLVWSKPKQNPIEYTMDGQIDPMAQAAAAARDDIEKTLGFVPQFFVRTSDHVLPGAWAEFKSIQLNPNTALSGKVKELIGLAVASQVPCTYCTLAHTEFARLNGASDEEVNEAISMSALTRHWSTVLNGMQLDPAVFSKEIAKLLDNSKKAQSPKPEINVVDAKTARADIERAMGFVPSFMSQFPEAGLAGAWRELRDLELSETTALGAKEKSLIGLAVAAQIPCKFCVDADTQFAKLAGATDQEIQEAVAMSALTRHWSTILNGTQADQAQFRADIQRLIAGAKKQRQS